MELEFTVRATVERQEGKFAGRAELCEAILSELESADPGSLDAEAGGTYEVTEWQVETVEPVPAARARPVRLALSRAEARALLGLRRVDTAGTALRSLELVRAALEEVKS